LGDRQGDLANGIDQFVLLPEGLRHLAQVDHDGVSRRSTADGRRRRRYWRLR
jgi:hypothetical protein